MTRPTCWRHSKLCIIGPGATGLRAVANTIPQWKGHERDNRYPATHETCGIAKAEKISIMKPHVDQPKAPKSRPAQDEVAKKAHAIYLKEGRPQGHDVKNWLEAETEMPHAGPDHHAHMAADSNPAGLGSTSVARIAWTSFAPSPPSIPSRRNLAASSQTNGADSCVIQTAIR